MSAQVVVVEDEPDVLEMLRDLLTMDGFSVIGLVRPELVRTIDSRVRPALFLIDLMLPGMSGIELVEELRSEGHKHTPMIAMSASRLMLEYAQRSDLFQGVLSKPFDVSDLLECVGRNLAPTLLH